MKILISGGSGMLGSYLIPLLLSKGHTVVNLTTKKTLINTGNIEHVYWNPAKGELNHASITGIEAIVNLAGYNLSNRWTDSNQRLMVDSRLDSTRLLVGFALKASIAPHVFISASGSGYYKDSQEWMDESGYKGSGFIADLTKDWEDALTPLLQRNIRTVIMRTGVILDKEHGALAKMIPFFRWGLGSAVGSGKQHLSWIHAHDAANAYAFALENANVQGTYNLATNNPVTNKEFSKVLAQVLQKPFFLPNIPGFILRLLFGKMSQLVLRSTRMSAQKLMSAGFQFKFPELKEALTDVFKTNS